MFGLKFDEKTATVLILAGCCWVVFATVTGCGGVNKVRYILG